MEVIKGSITSIGWPLQHTGRLFRWLIKVMKNGIPKLCGWFGDQHSSANNGYKKRTIDMGKVYRDGEFKISYLVKQFNQSQKIISKGLWKVFQIISVMPVSFGRTGKMCGIVQSVHYWKSNQITLSVYPKSEALYHLDWWIDEYRCHFIR